MDKPLYKITKIESKRMCRNKYHAMMMGQQCVILDLTVGTYGRLRVDMPYDPGFPHRFVTTPVQRVEELDDGGVIFETENTVYTLALIDGSEEPEEKWYREWGV